jgi:uncharacterized protein YkwD
LSGEPSDVGMVRLALRSFLVALAAALAALLTAASAQAPARDAGGLVPISAAQAACPNGSLTPSARNLDEVREAILCLHNRERARHGLAPLRENSKLLRAAESHSTDMVARSYFDHTSRSGADMVDRILRSGYVRRGEAWSLGENIAWGTGYLGTPAKIHRTWMSSAGHRANILRASFREIGIGVVTGNPSRGGAASRGATYTADFGVRR